MREFEGIWKSVVRVLTFGFVVFHLWTGLFGLLPSLEQRAVHIGLAVSLVFIFRPGRKTGHVERGVPWWDLVLIVLILLSAGNIFFSWAHYMPVMLDPATSFELFLAAVAIILVLEAGRRSVGVIFPSLTALVVAYTLWGHYIPGKFGHPPMDASIILKQIYFTPSGLWGRLAGLSATYLILFVIFAAILLVCGGGRTFIDLAMLLAGKFRGGPAKVAVFASSFFAMLSGSSMVNVATTGSFTIPMMKKLGYKSEFAGAVESTASTGGAVTPPIMGSAGFIMAEFLGIPYLKICIATAIPAFLFYLSVFMGVHFEAVKRNLAPIPRKDLPPLKSILNWKRLSPLILPITALLYTLFSGYSLIMVGTSACLTALVTYIFSDISLHGIKQRIWNFPFIFENATKTATRVVPVLLCASILLCLLDYTGLGIKLSSTIMSIGKANIALSLFMTAGLVMILGCGLMTTASYLLGVVAGVPLLISWGIPDLAAHLFVLYYSVLANLTPPVCPAVYVGASLADAPWTKTAWISLKLAPLLYLMPFLLVLDNTFIMVGAPSMILLNVGTAILGGIVLPSGAMGQLLTKCNIPARLALVASGLLLLVPGWQTDLLGIALVSVILVKQLQQRKKMKG